LTCSIRYCLPVVWLSSSESASSGFLDLVNTIEQEKTKVEAFEAARDKARTAVAESKSGFMKAILEQDYMSKRLRRESRTNVVKPTDVAAERSTSGSDAHTASATSSRNTSVEEGANFDQSRPSSVESDVADCGTDVSRSMDTEQTRKWRLRQPIIKMSPSEKIVASNLASLDIQAMEQAEREEKERLSMRSQEQLAALKHMTEGKYASSRGHKGATSKGEPREVVEI